MFERLQHRRVAIVLRALNTDLLRAHRCYFGGGTAIVLRHGEYRESADIDFLVSDRDGYRGLRERLTGTAGINQVRDPSTKDASHSTLPVQAIWSAV